MQKITFQLNYWTALFLSVNCLLGSPAQGLEIGCFVGEDLQFEDLRKQPCRLGDWGDATLVAVVFIGVDCPLAKLYGPTLSKLSDQYGATLKILAVDSNRRDSADRLWAWQQEFAPRISVFLDSEQHVADAFGAKRNPEVFLLGPERQLLYRGRIDDQYTTTRRRDAPIREDLVRAIEDWRNTGFVEVAETEPTGCFIDRRKTPEAALDVTYYEHIAPILQTRCVRCHRDGQSAPFALTSYEHVHSWLETIDEVVSERRMPPWFADQRYGDFANDASLTPLEHELLRRWFAAGGPAGDPSLAAPLQPLPSSEWNIGAPDFVVGLPAPQHIPETGIVDYRVVVIDPQFKEDKWVQAAEVRPTNPAVVHHVNVYLHTQEQRWNELYSAYLAVTAPGRPPMVFPDGMAKFVPAGSKLVFQLHYQTIGSPQIDQTKLGLRFADPQSVHCEVATNGLIAADEIHIPPGVANYPVQLTTTLADDFLLLALTPHMHARGKSCRYEAVYRNGHRETLLNIPRWDFNWQDRYVLARPKLLRAGTKIVAYASFDNSASNPFNPDPEATVIYGPQSSDEMFNAWYEVVRADQDLQQPWAMQFLTSNRRQRLFQLALCIGIYFLAKSVWNSIQSVRASQAAATNI